MIGGAETQCAYVIVTASLKRPRAHRQRPHRFGGTSDRVVARDQEELRARFEGLGPALTTGRFEKVTSTRREVAATGVVPTRDTATSWPYAAGNRAR